MAVPTINQYWIRPDALTFTLNTPDVDYLRVTTLSGAVIMAYVEGVIGYDALHNYRKWTLQTADTFLESTGEYYVHAQLTRSESSSTALIIYSPTKRSIDGKIVSADGSESGEEDTNHFYIYLGKLSASVDKNGNKVARTWLDNISTGILSTNQGENEKDSNVYLSKTKPDTAAGHLTFAQGFTSDDNSSVNGNLDVTGKVSSDSIETQEVSAVKVNASEQVNTKVVSTKKISSKEDKILIDANLDIEGNVNINDNTSVVGSLSVAKEAHFQGEVHHDKDVTFGDGAVIKQLEDGSWQIDTDHLVVKRKATFTSLEIQDVHHIGGQQILSAASAELVYVDSTNSVCYKCYFRKSDGSKTIQNNWEIGDLAYCNTFNVSEMNGQNVENHFYWRAVYSVDSVGSGIVQVDGVEVDLADCYCINLSKSIAAENSDAPLAGDHVVLLGHKGTDTDRRNAIVVAGAGQGSPYIAQYTDIKEFVLPEPDTLIKPNENFFAGKVVVKGSGKYQGEIESIAEQVLGEANEEADTIFKNVRYSKYNMLRNTGFTGDYLATQVNDTLVSEDLELFSDPLVHWQHSNVAIEASGESMSGYVAVLSNGSLAQALSEQQVIKGGRTYTLSFKAKGEKITIVAGDYREEILLSDSMTDYVRRFTATSDVYTFGIGGTCEVCELQIGLGEAASQWGMSVLDNQNVMGLIQSFQYLTDAIKNGKTEILGGLILSDIIMCGDTPQEGEERQITSGISGQYDEADDVAFWAGGNLSEAIQLVAKMKENPRLSDEEWENLAKFAVTHGGDVFMRGYIHALGGIFKNCLAENLQIDGGLIRAEKEIDKKSKIVITISDEMIGDADVNALTISRFYKEEETDLEYSEQPIIKLNCDSRGNTGYLQIMNNEGSYGLFSSVTMEGGAIEVEYDDRNGNTSTVTINNGTVKIAAGDDVAELGARSLSIGNRTSAQDSQVFLKLPSEANATQGCLCKDSDGYIKIKK